MMVEVIIGIVILVLFQIFDKHTIRVDFNKVGAFLGFMAFVTCARIAGYDFGISINPEMMPDVPPELLKMGVWKFMLIFWEDAFFALPIYLAFKYLKTHWAVLIALILSFYFGLGHLYQGWWGFAVTSLYPFFISYRYGKRVGFGTVMVCHIVYDFITFYTIYFLPHLIGNL